MITHLRDTRRPALALCASGRSGRETTPSLTSDPKLVTCKHCLKKMAKTPAAPVIEVAGPARLFNENRDPRLPELAAATGSILETIWEDDYESFGLVNPDDDPEGFALVSKLDRLVRESGCRPLTTREIEDWKENGWHDREEGGSDDDVFAALRDVEAFATLDELFHLFASPE